MAAANLARIELNSEQPRADVLRVCGLFLKGIGSRVQIFIGWIAAKGDTFFDAFLKELRKRAAQGMISYVAAIQILRELHIDLSEVVNAIFHAFK